MKKYSFIILMILNLSVYSQPFEKTYLYGNASSMIQKDDSSFIVAVSYLSHGLLNLSPGGVFIDYKDFSYNTINDLIKSNEGGYLITGELISELSPSIIRLDNLLDTLWVKTLPGGGSVSTWGIEMIELPDSTILITTANGAGMGYFELELYRLDKNGDIIWKANPVAFDDTRSSIYQLAYKDTIVYAVSNNNNPQTLHIGSFGIPTGNNGWTKDIYDTNDVYDYLAYSIIETGNHLYIPGTLFHDSLGTTIYKQMLIKTDLNGDTIWLHEYEEGRLVKIISTAPNSFYCLSGSVGDSIGLMRLDSNGVVLWKENFQKYDWALPFDLIPTSDGGIAFCGEVVDTTTNILYTYVVRTDSLGNVPVNTKIISPENKLNNCKFTKTDQQLIISIDEYSKPLLASIYSSDGKIILEKKITGGKNFIDTQLLISGYYVVIISSGNEIVARYRFVE